MRQRTTIDAFLAQARRRLTRLDPAAALSATRFGATLVDICADTEITRDRTIPGAIVIPGNTLEWRLDPTGSHRHPNAPQLDLVILVCHEGYQSSLAAATLQQLGFAHATDVIGGFQAWLCAGLAVEQSDPKRQAI